MKLYITMLVLMLSLGCATTHISSRRNTYTWDVSVAPVNTREYEFRGKLTRCAGFVDYTMPVAEGKNEADIISLPPLRVTPDKPASINVGVPGKDSSIKATVTVQDTPKKAIVTYSAMIREAKAQYVVNGTVEISK